jgi:predicted aldo/keto reductase-like oxidoreductase
MSITRRTLLEAIPFGAAAQIAMGAATDPKTGMPTRVFGKTGARISVAAMGCGSRLLSYGTEEKAVEVLHKAMDLGVNYLDSAYSYGNGKSETWVGKALQGRRKGIWVTTKINARDGDKAQQIIEGSLKRLGLDQVDLIHVHSLLGMDDLAKVEAEGGVLKVLYKLRDQKVTRFIGVTSHTDPTTLGAALERHDFDCTQMALNAALVGMTSGKGGMVINKAMKDSFEHIALPVALKKKMGVTAMKVFAQGGLSHAASIDQLIRYALSLPVTAAVMGMPQPENIDENIRLAKAFKPLKKSEMKDLSKRLSEEHKAQLDLFFRDHVDA